MLIIIIYYLFMCVYCTSCIYMYTSLWCIVYHVCVSIHHNDPGYYLLYFKRDNLEWTVPFSNEYMNIMIIIMLINKHNNVIMNTGSHCLMSLTEPWQQQTINKNGPMHIAEVIDDPLPHISPITSTMNPADKLLVRHSTCQALVMVPWNCKIFLLIWW